MHFFLLLVVMERQGLSDRPGAVFNPINAIDYGP
jgi:hypothetical protein